MKNILIAGATGFIGQALVHHYQNQQVPCVVIGRSIEKIKTTFPNSVTALNWENETALIAAIKAADVIINLAGANISDKRWTDYRKEELLTSRLGPTKVLAELCASLGANSPPLFNASAIGIYGLQNSTANHLPPPYTEDTFLDFERAPDFLAEIGRQWELATIVAKDAGVRVVNMRFAPVLGKNGGILQKLIKPFLLGLGGKIGNGQQPFCWITLPDLIKIIEFLLPQKDITGPINFVAPECVTQAEFAKTLATILHRPHFATTPPFILKLILGREMAQELLLQGQHVKPARLMTLGFQFTYPRLAPALKSILS